MSYYLGIDTSNYTTSVAIYDSDNKSVINKKMLLPVKNGEKGIRQSDAVFHHTIQLPKLFRELFDEIDVKIDAIGVSVKPCNDDNSYMPCFLAGVSVAVSLSETMNIPLYEFSHQDGHIAAALYSSGMLDLFYRDFLAFHISGGTSQALLVSPASKYFKTVKVSDSLDLKAGQAIDRVGVSMGLQFPCGPELEKLALKSEKNLTKIKVFRRDGYFSLSGVENKCKKMLAEGTSYEDVALYCLSYIYSALDDTVSELLDKNGNLPVVFSGGVMSNSIIRNEIKKKYDAYFAEPKFSADNACGVALLASFCYERNKQ